MLDIKLIREKPDLIKEAFRKRGESLSVDNILQLDEKRRQLLQEVEKNRAEQRIASKKIGKLQQGKNDDPGIESKVQEMIRDMRHISDTISSIEIELGTVEDEFRSLLLEMPNLPDPSVPLGDSADDNVLLRNWGESKDFSYQPHPHWELGEQLGIIDFERGSKMSGTRFYVLKGLGAHLERALINFMLDLHVNEHGFTEIYPPFMVKRECMIGSGNLPKFGDNLYHDAEEDFWWVPTAEVPLTNFHRDEILEPGSLPLHYVAYTPCFRREKMAAGRETRGLKRGHQFDKVELYKFVEPEHSDSELGSLMVAAESVCQRLEIPYRVIQLCTADLGFPSAKTYDIEAWAPGCDEWLEVSSCSNCTDFQARRANVRYRPWHGDKPRFVHTLNGSGLALPRVVICILENFQNSDGSVSIPGALQPYMGTDIIR